MIGAVCLSTQQWLPCGAQENKATVAISENTKKQMILEAAARLFRDKGYSATSMRDLARAVDLKASSLYNHIDSKEDLLRDICFHNARQFHQRLQEIESMPEGEEAQLRALIHLHIQTATEDLTSITAFNDEWRHLTEPHLSEFIGMRKDYERRFRAIIEKGIAGGVFKPIDSTIALYTILSAVRWVYDWYKPGRSVNLQQLEKEIAGILLDGLKV